MASLLSKGQQLLDCEQKIKDLRVSKKNSITELNAELRKLEDDRTALREEVNSKIASYKPQKEDSSRGSSLSSMLSLKFVTSSPKLGLDPMSAINSKRQRIQKIDGLISQNIELRKKEEARQLQIQKISKEIARIVDSIVDLDRLDIEKSKTEKWCIESISRLKNEIEDAKESIDNYQKAIPLILEARKAIGLIIDQSNEAVVDDHLQKVILNNIESNSFIADTYLSQAWNYLSIADPDHDDNIIALPPLPEDILTWATEVKPVVDQLLTSTKPCISKKEKDIKDNESKLSQIKDKLFQERRLILIEAVKGPKHDLPDYNDVLQRRINTISTSGKSKVGTESNDYFPPLPPRSQSCSKHGSSNLLASEVHNAEKIPLNNIPIDLEGFYFPHSSEPQLYMQNDKFETRSVESKLPIESLCSISDSNSRKWDVTSNNDVPQNLELEVNLSQPNYESSWQSQTTIDQGDNTQLVEQDIRSNNIHESWLNHSSNHYDLKTECNASIGGDSILTERMAEMYSKQTTEIENTKLPKLPSQSEMLGLNDNPWN